MSCDCRRYPVLEKVLVLRTDKSIRRVNDYLERGCYRGAFRFLTSTEEFHKYINTYMQFHERIPNIANFLYVLLSLSRLSITRFSAALKRSLKKDSIQNIKVSFCEVMNKLGWGAYGDYLIHRFSSETFWNIYPLLPLVEKTGTPILDFGCGVGHASFIFSQFFPRGRGHFE